MCHRRFWSRCIRGAKFAVLAGVVCALVFMIAPWRETQEPVFKIGFVDMARLFSEYYRTKTVRAEFEAEFNKEQEEIDRRKADLEEELKELEAKADTLSEAELRDLRQRYSDQVESWRTYAQGKDRDLRRKKERVERELLLELQKAVEEYGTREGYSVIVRKSMLLYGSQTCDVTQDIIDTVNRPR